MTGDVDDWPINYDDDDDDDDGDDDGYDSTASTNQKYHDDRRMGIEWDGAGSGELGFQRRGFFGGLGKRSDSL